MNTHANKTQEKKNQSVANKVAQKQSSDGSAFQFEDNRPESIAQRKLQEMANNSPQPKRIAQLQAMANNSPQAKRIAQLQEMADNYSRKPVQKKGTEEEELLQGKFKPIQKQEIEEDEILQGKFKTIQKQEIEEEELIQNKFEPIQKKKLEEDELQMKEAPVRKKARPELSRWENKTGIPDNLKSGIENLSGYSMDDVKVHRNSDKPAQLNAHAYTQGTDIHLGPGQEKHLPHEAWHVVQQKQGRVKPTAQMKTKLNINDDAELENEADQMGAKALKIGIKDKKLLEHPLQREQINSLSVNSAAGLNDLSPIQRKRDVEDPQTLVDFTGNTQRGDDATTANTLETVQGNYNKSLTSGKKVKTEGLKWFINAPDKKQAISNDDTTAKVDTAGYKVFWFFRGEDSVTIMMTRGSMAGASISKEVSGYSFDEFEDDQDFLYANTFNVITGAFHASINYRKQDDEMALEQELPKALPNSEIIWFMQAHAKQVYAKKNTEAGPLSNLKSISREQIGNTQTLDTIFMCDENRVAYKNGTVTIGTPTEEAIALLGSPNGNSAVWVLIQHAPSGTVDIEKIEFSKNGLIIHYMSS